jgi:hypothetical protein
MRISGTKARRSEVETFSGGRYELELRNLIAKAPAGVLTQLYLWTLEPDLGAIFDGVYSLPNDARAKLRRFFAGALAPDRGYFPIEVELDRDGRLVLEIKSKPFVGLVKTTTADAA